MIEHEMQHVITLTLGDWSSDGHSITETRVFNVNLPHNAIKQAYEDGTKILGFDLTEEVASEYEDRKIDEEKIKKLQSLGFSSDFFEDPHDEDGSYWLDTESFVELWLFVVQLGNTEFRYMPHNTGRTFNIGGYGLYSN